MKPDIMHEICPVCGSSELYLEAGGYTGKIYHCKNCDYTGALVVEADGDMARAIREDYEQRKRSS
jgi:transposase-like protein